MRDRHHVGIDPRLGLAHLVGDALRDGGSDLIADGPAHLADAGVEPLLLSRSQIAQPRIQSGRLRRDAAGKLRQDRRSQIGLTGGAVARHLLDARAQSLQRRILLRPPRGQGGRGGLKSRDAGAQVSELRSGQAGNFAADQGGGGRLRGVDLALDFPPQRCGIRCDRRCDRRLCVGQSLARRRRDFRPDRCQRLITQPRQCVRDGLRGNRVDPRQPLRRLGLQRRRQAGRRGIDIGLEVRAQAPAATRRSSPAEC